MKYLAYQVKKIIEMDNEGSFKYASYTITVYNLYFIHIFRPT